MASFPDDVQRQFRQINVKPSGLALAGVVILVVVIGFSALFQVAPEEEAVVLRFGKHIRTVGPGLHMKLPLGIDKVYLVPVRAVDVEEFGYRSARGRDYVYSGYEEETSMLTGDLNIVLAGWDVQFSRTDPQAYLFRVEEPIPTLRDISQSVMREVMGDRASIPILTVGRAEIQREVRRLIQQSCDQFEMGLTINEVNLLFVDPPDQVLEAFNDLNKGEQDALRFFEEASKEYQEKVPRARGEARRVILEAEGFREQRVNVANGEADRFIEMLKAYEQSPSITRRRLYLETLETTLPTMNEVVIVDQEMRSLLPLFNVRQSDNAASAPRN